MEETNSLLPALKPAHQSKGVNLVRTMTLIQKRTFSFGTILLASISVMAQQTAQPKAPAQAPATKNAPAQTAPPDKNAQPAAKKKPDQAAAYYHYGLAHMYEEMAAMYGRSEFANKAI